MVGQLHRRPATLLAGLLAAVVLVGCTNETNQAIGNTQNAPVASASGTNSSGDATGTVSPTDGPVQVTPASGGKAATGGATVTIPPGAVAGTGALTVTRGDSLVANALEDVTPVGSALEVELTGTKLMTPATVTFSVDPTQFDGTTHIPVVVWQDTDTTWRWLPTSWERGGSEVSAQTDHFSVGYLGSLDVNAMAMKFSGNVRDYLTGRSGVAQPSCGDEDAARGTLRITSDGGDTTKWCLGIANGRSVLKIANNRRTYAAITYPASWDVLDSGGLGISLDALVRSTSGALGEIAAPADTAVRIVSGGDTLTLALPDGSAASGHVSVATDLIAWSLTGIVMAYDLYAGTLSKAGWLVGNVKSGFPNLLSKVSDGAVDASWREAWKECMRAVSDNLTDHPLDPITDSLLAADVLKTVWFCGPSLGKAYFLGTGLVSGWLASAVLGAVASAVSLILTAANLIITGVRELVDTFASFAGRSDPIYDIVIDRASTLPAGGTVSLGAGGSFDGTSVFAPEQDVAEFISRQLGPPDDIFERGMCEAGGLAGKRVTWGNLTMLVVDDGAAFLANSVPKIDANGPIVVGWEYWLIKTGTDEQALETAENIGLGASLVEVLEAYPDSRVGEDFDGSTYAEVFRGDFSNMTFGFNQNQVIAISSGSGCGE